MTRRSLEAVHAADGHREWFRPRCPLCRRVVAAELGTRLEPAPARARALAAAYGRRRAYEITAAGERAGRTHVGEAEARYWSNVRAALVDEATP